MRASLVIVSALVGQIQEERTRLIFIKHQLLKRLSWRRLIVLCFLFVCDNIYNHVPKTAKGDAQMRRN